METYPLYSRTFEEARAFQFKVVDAATHHFNGAEALDLGDLGVVKGTNRPLQTIRVEKVFADAFDAEDACLVRGAGTGALRWSLVAALKPGGTILVHDAPIYPTTKVTLDTMGAKTVIADFNDDEKLRQTLDTYASVIDAALIQHSRQKPDDSYELGHVIDIVREKLGNVPIVTDDNYAATKVKAIGCQLGADLSVEKARSLQYSGGSQVQGHEAMAALRGLIYAPVALSITGATCHEVAKRLNAGELRHVKAAFVANAESKAVLVEFDEDVANDILAKAPAHGAAPHPVGCESKYEFLPMFYRISGTFRAKNPSWEKRMIRINVMRSGPDTVIRILRELIDEVYGREDK